MKHLLLALLLLTGCSDSSRNGPAYPVPDPQDLNQPAFVYGTAGIQGTTLWAPTILIDYQPHPSVRLTHSVLRPGEFNTPIQRLLEEVVLTRPDADNRINPHVAGPPPGWQVVALVGRIVLGTEPFNTVDFNTGLPVVGTRLIEANGLTDPVRRVIWCWAVDDAVTPEGSALMPAYSHELLHAHVYEDALARGLTHDQAARESKAIDP